MCGESEPQGEVSPLLLSLEARIAWEEKHAITAAIPGLTSWIAYDPAFCEEGRWTHGIDETGKYFRWWNCLKAAWEDEPADVFRTQHIIRAMELFVQSSGSAEAARQLNIMRSIHGSTGVTNGNRAA